MATRDKPAEWRNKCVNVRPETLFEFVSVSVSWGNKNSQIRGGALVRWCVGGSQVDGNREGHACHLQWFSGHGTPGGKVLGQSASLPQMAATWSGPNWWRKNIQQTMKKCAFHHIHIYTFKYFIKGKYFQIYLSYLHGQLLNSCLHNPSGVQGFKNRYK